MFSRSIFAVLFLVAAGSVALASSPRTVTWDDLVPAMAPLENPFEHLTMNQRVELSMIAQERETAHVGTRVEQGRRGRLSAKNLTRKLEGEGLDVDALLAKHAEVKAAVFERGRSVVNALDNQAVRLAGYILPLEFDGTDVKEFLLVPYVGACIHVPPPPPNQIVFVRSDEPFKSDDLFTAVWVTGRMTVASSTRSLTLVDGTAPIATGYTLKANRIEIYEE